MGTIRPQPRPDTTWIQDQSRPAPGKPEQAFFQYMADLDLTVRTLLGGSALIAVAVPNNANAAAAGVKLGQLYCSTANPAQVYVRTA